MMGHEYEVEGLHLNRARHLLFDWMAGCVAVTNPEIEELWRVVPVGTEVEITS